MDHLPPLNALRAFEAAARHLSFKLAGRELHVTPGAVSRHIANLEAYLGARLFVRHHRQVVLTRAGKAYLRDVRDGLHRIAHATGVLMSGCDENVLRIKSPPTFAIRWLVPRLAEFHARYPDMSVQVTTSHDPVDFDFDDVDAAIQYGAALDRTLAGERLFREVLVPVCSPKRAGPSGTMSPRDLAAEVLLHSLRRPDDWPRWFEAAGAPGLDLKQKLVFENSSLTYQGAIDGLGVAVAQIALVRDELMAGRLVTPSRIAVKRDVSYFLAYPRERARRKKFKLLQGWIAREVRRMGSDPSAFLSSPIREVAAD